MSDNVLLIFLRFLSRLWHTLVKVKEAKKEGSSVRYDVICRQICICISVVGFCACSVDNMFPEESWILEWIQIRVDGQTQLGYATCGRAKFQIRNKNSRISGYTLTLKRIPENLAIFFLAAFVYNFHASYLAIFFDPLSAKHAIYDVLLNTPKLSL